MCKLCDCPKGYAPCARHPRKLQQAPVLHIFWTNAAAWSSSADKYMAGALLHLRTKRGQHLRPPTALPSPVSHGTGIPSGLRSEAAHPPLASAAATTPPVHHSPPPPPWSKMRLVECAAGVRTVSCRRQKRPQHTAEEAQIPTPWAWVHVLGALKILGIGFSL